MSELKRKTYANINKKVNEDALSISDLKGNIRIQFEQDVV